MATYKHPQKYFGKVDGVVHFRGVSKEFLGFVEDIPVQKSGTHWVGEIVTQILNNGEASSQHSTFIEGQAHYRSIKSKEELHQFYLNYQPRVFYTHLHYHQLPIGDGNEAKKPKFVYVVRNPKDVAVSFYHHVKCLRIYDYGEHTWDEFFDMFINGAVHYGSWFDHIISWWPHRHDSNVLYLKYEDLKKDLPSGVQKIANFVGKDISEEIIEQIADQTSFKAMAADQSRFEKKGLMPGTQFLRKGEVGDWKNYFTVKQNEIFDELIKTKLTWNPYGDDNY